MSAKGNSFLNVDGHNLGGHMNKFKRWGYRIGSRFSAKTYATKDEAKLALFDEFWATTQDVTGCGATTETMGQGGRT